MSLTRTVHVGASAVQFPADMTDEAIAAALEQQFAPPPPPRPPSPQPAVIDENQFPARPAPEPAPRQRFGVSPTYAEELEVSRIVPKDARLDLRRHRMPRVLRRPPR